MTTYTDDLNIALALSDFPSWERQEILRRLYESPALRAFEINPFAHSTDAKTQETLWKLTKEIATEYRKSSDTRPFPIQDGTPYRNSSGSLVFPKGCQIPWWLAEVAYKEYQKRYPNDQTIDMIAKRGGFGREELLAFLQGTPL